jgi:16S rRNA (cytidine1402-2'-O)-methyltransferase
MTDAPLAPALYLVGTPIGNLEDITLRALRVLRDVSRIACEDTRQTQKLLNHFDIHTKTTSYHEHNEVERAPELIARIQAGDSIALVTDAGMPAVSDPGQRLVTLAIENQVTVIPIPGASAFLSALVASGLGADNFQFHAFLPSKTGQRRQLIEKLKVSDRVHVFYEAPHRIVETLKDIAEILGPSRHVVVARELTKIHEEFLRGTAEEILEIAEARGEIKGEITLLIGEAKPAEAPAPNKESIAQMIARLMQQESLEEKDALKRVARELGISKSEAYREFQRTRK